MTQQEAAKWLWDVFYLHDLSKANPPERIPKVPRLRDNKMELPTVENCEARRRHLLPEGFRFTWPNLPGPGELTTGARYL